MQEQKAARRDIAFTSRPCASLVLTQIVVQRLNPFPWKLSEWSDDNANDYTNINTKFPASVGVGDGYGTSAQISLSERLCQALLAYPDQGRAYLNNILGNDATKRIHVKGVLNDPEVYQKDITSCDGGTCDFSSVSKSTGQHAHVISSSECGSEQVTTTIHVRKPTTYALEADDAVLNKWETSCSNTSYQSTQLHVFSDDLDVTRKVTSFQSSNEAIATVSSTGFVKGLSSGTVTLTAVHSSSMFQLSLEVSDETVALPSIKARILTEVASDGTPDQILVSEVDKGYMYAIAEYDNNDAHLLTTDMLNVTVYEKVNVVEESSEYHEISIRSGSLAGSSCKDLLMIFFFFLQV